MSPQKTDESIPTPCYVIREAILRKNMVRIERLREASGARCLLALKCFASWALFDRFRDHMDGTTGSSLYEARLGRERFGKEVHAYSVAFTRDEVRDVRRYADKVIFNSVSQFETLSGEVGGRSIGLRVNPGTSSSPYDLADPARRYSRLGIAAPAAVANLLPFLSGLMFHYNCDNDDIIDIARGLEHIGRKYGEMMKVVEWVSLGGGFSFTGADFPLAVLSRLLKSFAERWGVTVYLEPGEAAISGAGELWVTVLDIVRNEIDIAIVDASVEAHMTDLLIYGTTPPVVGSGRGGHRFTLAGRSCLAGDVFGVYDFPRALRIGDRIRIGDAAGYTIVKSNWFNGLAMPSVAVERADGSVEVLRTFGYRDFTKHLS